MNLSNNCLSFVFLWTVLGCSDPETIGRGNSSQGGMGGNTDSAAGASGEATAEAGAGGSDTSQAGASGQSDAGSSTGGTAPVAGAGGRALGGSGMGGATQAGVGGKAQGGSGTGGTTQAGVGGKAQGGSGTGGAGSGGLSQAGSGNGGSAGQTTASDLITETMDHCQLTTNSTPEISTIDIPLELTDANWGQKDLTCRDAGFDLSLCAGKAATMTSFESVELANTSGVTTLGGIIFTYENEVCCVLVTEAAPGGGYGVRCGPTYPALNAISECAVTFHQSDERTTETLTLPSELETDAVWGPRVAVCEEGGYELASCAGSEVVLFSAFENTQLEDHPDPIRIFAVTSGDSVCCLWETDGAEVPVLQTPSCAAE